MAADKIQISTRFAEELHLKITHIAREKYRSLNAQLEHLAQECIDAYEQEKGEILLSDEDRQKYRV